LVLLFTLFGDVELKTLEVHQMNMNLRGPVVCSIFLLNNSRPPPSPPPNLFKIKFSLPRISPKLTAHAHFGILP
jgi:hypothetical protein